MMSEKYDSLSWPSEARNIICAIHENLHWLHGQLLGMSAEWPEGTDARAQFVRNMRAHAKDLAENIEKLDNEIFVPTPKHAPPVGELG